MRARCLPKSYIHMDTFEPIRDQHINVSYSGLHFHGDVGYEDVNIAGIKVPKQEIGIINYADNLGG